MGQRMCPIPIEYGDDCLARFDAGKTPKYMFVWFIELIRCAGSPLEPPNGRVFKVTQDPVAACYYRYDSASWGLGVDINAAPNPTDIFLADQAGVWSYFLARNPQAMLEGFVYPNDFVACPAWQGSKDGFCSVTWTPQATALLAAVCIEKSCDLFMELFPKADRDLVYKFCRKRDATNIKFLITP